MLTEPQFLADIATHEMQVLRDDGLYRHIRFKRPGTMCMHFDLITWPGHLCYAGDMGTFVFSRIADMFEFFRTDRACHRPRPGETLFINLGYWSEKLVAVDGNRHQAGAMELCEDTIRSTLNGIRLDWIREARREGVLDSDERRDLWESVDIEVLDKLDYQGCDAALQAAYAFNWAPRIGAARSWAFQDLWECNFSRYTRTFTWCCYALAWGVAQYDKAAEQAGARVPA